MKGYLWTSAWVIELGRHETQGAGMSGRCFGTQGTCFTLRPFLIGSRGFHTTLCCMLYLMHWGAGHLRRQ